ncbi:MAG: hypothetical protein LH650_11245 [Chloroflexi bacterium]|nr:hypothetical protein [Chloroflexota bacterium]
MVAASAVGITAQSPSAPAGPPLPLGNGAKPAGTYWATPIGSDSKAPCEAPPAPNCSATAPDDEIRIAFTVPDGWSGFEGRVINPTAVGYDAPDGAALLFMLGDGL